MAERLDRNGLQVDARLVDFVETRALPGSGVAPAAFWSGLASTLADLAPRNHALLQRRAALQAQIDAWHIAHRAKAADPAAYQAFLREIGYLLPEGPDFQIGTANVDPEIASIAGPQLVVPVMNARYAPVSYTHLDVYKRQLRWRAASSGRAWRAVAT